MYGNILIENSDVISILIRSSDDLMDLKAYYYIFSLIKKTGNVRLSFSQENIPLSLPSIRRKIQQTYATSGLYEIVKFNAEYNYVELKSIPQDC